MARFLLYVMHTSTSVNLFVKKNFNIPLRNKQDLVYLGVLDYLFVVNVICSPVYHKWTMKMSISVQLWTSLVNNLKPTTCIQLVLDCSKQIFKLCLHSHSYIHLPASPTIFKCIYPLIRTKHH
jgi:hypothetical protein